MTEDDKKVLQEQDNDTLAEWWCTLNRWDWPEGLPDPMTGEERRKDYDPANRATRMMHWIEERVGHKKVSRWWNKDNMTDEQHDLFY